MRIADIFEVRVEEKIEPVVKVAEVRDEAKLAAEIGAYVVTPTIEKYVDDFLEHYTTTYLLDTGEVGCWISGYFGSGKSYLAKMLALLAQNRTLAGTTAAERFAARIPATAPRRTSLSASLKRLGQADTQVLGFNLNTQVDSKTTPLPRLLLNQYYQFRGYCSNLLYARVIEQELDERGKLEALHAAAAASAKQPWETIRKNPSFHARHLYAAACTVAPDVFGSADEVGQALQQAEKGELYNAQFVVQTMLDAVAKRERETKTPCRLLIVLDEAGQWIGDQSDRLNELLGLIEEAAEKGRGKLWVFVTTHEDMGSMLLPARRLKPDLKKTEGRFRFKFGLTTENIELVLEDRLFKKKLPGGDAVAAAYDDAPGVLRGLGELANVTGHTLPDCERERFVRFYPFFPYQVHLIPEIVKSLRSRGGRSDQLSGSTRTLLAVCQDVMRLGRRRYLDLPVGDLVSFDEIYENLSGEGEVSPDVRRDLMQVEQVVPGATPLTRRVAEVLYLVHEISYIPRTIDNLARLMVESTGDDLPAVVARVQPELGRLMAAKLVARIGDEYEFLTGERRTFEDEVATVAGDLKHQDREAGLAKHFAYDPEKKANHLRDFVPESVPYLDAEFPVRISMDGTYATKKGDIEVRVISTLATLGGVKLGDLEDQSMRAEEKHTIFLVSDRQPGFDQDLNRYLAMSEVVKSWKSDPGRAEDARKLAEERESNDLEKLRRKVQAGLKTGIAQGFLVFQGSSRALRPKQSETLVATLKRELAVFWPNLYTKFDKVKVRITEEQKAITAVLKGESLPAEVKELGLFDKSGKLDPNAPLVDAIRIFLAKREGEKRRTIGGEVLSEFDGPPYGWDPNAVRVGVAACVRAGMLKVLIGKKLHANAADPALQQALRASREFDSVGLVLAGKQPSPEVLQRVRALLIKLTGNRKLDETPTALAEAMEGLGRPKRDRASKVRDWAEPAGLPEPKTFGVGVETLDAILAFTDPSERVDEIDQRAPALEQGLEAIDQLWAFREKWGASYVELRDSVAELRVVEHRLPANGAIRALLDEYEAAHASARLAEPAVWKQVHALRAAALLQLKDVMTAWRDTARDLVEQALDRLTGDLAQCLLEESLAPELAGPLDEFLASLETETAPARVAALPERARQLVDALGEALRREAEKREAETAAKAPKGAAPRPRRRVSFTDVATVRRVRTEAEWEDLQKKLDAHVRSLLKEYDVELE